MEKYNNHLKIAFVTSYDPNDKNSWSGTIYHINQALQRCGDVHYVGPVKTKIRFIPRAFNHLAHLIGKNYAYIHNSLLSKAYARKIEHELSKGSFDLIFAPSACTEIAYLKTDLPIVYLSDITFSLINDYYNDYFSNLLDVSKRDAEFIEGSTIKKADLLLYPSEWVAKSAINDYGADESKVFVIPFGANFDTIPSKDTILQKKKSNNCKLLFLGVDWERKGGKIAFETLLELEKLGIEAQLTVCGCIPPDEFSHKNMTVIPFLDKADPAQRKELDELFLGSDFLLLPTRNEAFGMVFSESSAFGLPVITTDTGGVSGVIDNGQNGFMLSIDAKASEYAELIRDIYQDDEAYYKLVKSSRETFDKKLNWDIWVKNVCKLINELLNSKK